MSKETNPGSLVPKPDLARELGVSSRTLSRWASDPTLSFPAPVSIRGRNYFDRASIERWKSERLRASLTMSEA